MREAEDAAGNFVSDYVIHASQSLSPDTFSSYLDSQVGLRLDKEGFRKLLKKSGVKGVYDTYPDRFGMIVLHQPDILPKGLCEAAASHIFVPRGIPIDQNDVEQETVAHPGTCTCLHDFALQHMLHEGKIILIPSPHFGDFVNIGGKDTSKVGQQLGLIETRDSGFKLTPEKLESAIHEYGRDRIGALIFTNPNNPSFQTYKRDEMQALANVIAKYDLPVINDELYSEMELDGRPHISLASLTADTPQGKKRLYDLALTVTGTSKLFNLSEDKAGLACSGNRQWIKQIQEAIRKDGLPFLKERALKAEAIIRHTTEAYKQESRRFHQELRDKFVEDIRQANHHLGADMIQLMASPEAGYYGCLTLEPSLCERYGITTSAQLGEYLYMVAGIITIPLSTMGTDQIGVRINLGGDTDIEDIKRRLKQVEVAVSRMENMARKMIDGTAPTYAYVAEQIEKQLSVQKTEDKTASRFA